MARQYWDINRGQTETQVVTGAASSGGNLEVNVDLTANMTREEVIRALHYIINFLLKYNWPPA